MKEHYTIYDVQGFAGMSHSRQNDLCEQHGIKRVMTRTQGHTKPVQSYTRKDFQRLMEVGGWVLADVEGRKSWVKRVAPDF